MHLTLSAVVAIVVAGARAEIFIGTAGIGTLLLCTTHFAGIAGGGQIARQQVDLLGNIPDHPVISQRWIGPANSRQILEGDGETLGIGWCVGPVEFRGYTVTEGFTFTAELGR